MSLFGSDADRVGTTTIPEAFEGRPDPGEAPPSRPGAGGFNARVAAMSASQRMLLYISAALLVLSLVRWGTDSDDLTSSGSVGAALRLGIPIMLAGLSGLWAERAGVVNIGIEGMMILGTWCGGFAAWQWGAWWGLALGVVGGLLGGLVHALATVTFNVDHIVSGVAINLLAVGVSRYLSAQVFLGQPGGGLTKSPPQRSAIPTVDVPFLSGGELFGWRSPDVLGWIERQGWPFVSDLAGIFGGATRQVSMAILLALGLLALSGWVLWRTRFGLRIRSCGEAPYAADSLGVSVAKSRYAALAISGGIAGLGGACLSVVSASAYAENQTGGRGFVGLATMIFGNWRPSGLLGGSMLFGYTEAIRLRDEREVTVLLLVGALMLLGLAIWNRDNPKKAGWFLGISAATFAVWALIDKVPRQLTTITPFVATLIVLAFASQRLRPPAAAGAPYRRGD